MYYSITQKHQLWAKPIPFRFILRALRAISKYILYITITTFDVEIQIRVQHITRAISYIKFHTLIRGCIISDIIGLDISWIGERFKVKYLALSLRYAARFTLSIQFNETSSLLSLTTIIPSANWQERELWDLFGILIKDHPDLRRILTDYGFLGHPLRKDFPLTGFFELWYNERIKQLCLKRVSLAQEYRRFTIQNPWHLHAKD